MKKQKFYWAVFSIISLILFENTSFGQSVLVDSIISPIKFFNTEGFTNFTERSIPKDIFITVNNQTTELKLEIGGIIKSGKVSFKIYNSVGEQQDDLTLLKTNKEKCLLYVVGDLPGEKSNQMIIHDKKVENPKTEGFFIRSYINPTPGTWKIKISPHFAQGKYKIYHILMAK